MKNLKSWPEKSFKVKLVSKPVYVCMLSHFSRVQLCNPRDCSREASLSMGFTRQEYWSGLPSSRWSSRSRDRTYVSCISCIDRQGFLPLLSPGKLSESVHRRKPHFPLGWNNELTSIWRKLITKCPLYYQSNIHWGSTVYKLCSIRNPVD